VLIPSPYYSAFDSDLRAFCNLRRVLVPLDPDAGYELTVDALEDAYRRAQKATGRNPAALLLTNPHNPLGRIMSRKEMKAVLDWCVGKSMHLVSDEIYALSTFGERMQGSDPSSKRKVDGGSSFVSFAEISEGQLSDHVHILWGVSKDFGMAGVRVGVVWSQNGLLLEALRNASKFTSVSGPIQAMVADLISDDEFVDAYIIENTRRICNNCEILLTGLDKLDISYVVPAAGMFVWVDFAPLLSLLETTSDSPLSDLEGELHERLLNELHIVITPGASQHAAKPGLFRICYASVSLSMLEDAVARLSKWVEELRRAAEGRSGVATCG